jgi:hypothetical protein
VAARVLWARYGIPVDGIGSVPDWAMNNARHQGPPSDDVDLALELDKLDLWH